MNDMVIGMSPRQSPTLDRIVADLAKSGLTIEDMMVRVIDEASREALNARAGTTGYVIPYFNILGKLTQYYRAKIFDADIKYLQLPKSPNHVYFPRNFPQAWAATKGKLCILTEGEKKAAICCKHGIPAVAFGGVDSWRNKTIVIPKGSDSNVGAGGAMTIKLPTSNIDESTLSTMAHGFEELMMLGLKFGTIFMIVYDSDSAMGVSAPAQRAAARLGYELRYKGFNIGQIRQLIPPHEFCDKEGRTTLEDLFIHPKAGPQKFIALLDENIKTRTTFPRHPAIREHIAKQLQKPKLDRKSAQNVSLALLTDLDCKGTRMYSADDLQMYYFNGDNNHLMKVDINTTQLVQGQEAEFGMMLYRDYSVSLSADSTLMRWLGSQFAAEQPVENVTPYRIVARPNKNEDIVRVQINNGQYVKITPDLKRPYQIMPNGSENTLFESQNNHIDGIDSDELEKELIKQHNAPLESWWNIVLQEVRLKQPGKAGNLQALLYYLSPYLIRWRGMQLPVEIVVGEAGSGKSSLCEIRLNILTGDSKLRNSPKELKDWHAALANSGGFMVTDNVNMTDKNLRQNMSDDLCRLVTEPDPRINMRKYFTEADERSIKVNAIFGFTAIQMPFTNGDLLQRAIVLELSKSAADETVFDGNWAQNQLDRFGGRTAWMAHQCVAIHKFFRLVQEKWNPNYKSKHRLINLEQSLVLMAEVFNLDGSWIPGYLAQKTGENITAADWAMEGLMEWAQEKRAQYELAQSKRQFVPDLPLPKFDAADIAAWAQQNEDYEECFQLANARSLGRYLQAHKHDVRHICGIEEIGKVNNKLKYIVRPLAAKVIKDLPSLDVSMRPKK